MDNSSSLSAGSAGATAAVEDPVAVEVDAADLLPRLRALRDRLASALDA